MQQTYSAPYETWIRGEPMWIECISQHLRRIVQQTFLKLQTATAFFLGGGEEVSYLIGLQALMINRIKRQTVVLTDLKNRDDPSVKNRLSNVPKPNCVVNSAPQF